MTAAQALGNIGLAHPANDDATTTITMSTADAIAVGQTLKALSRSAPGGCEAMARVGKQLVAAGLAAMGAKP